MAATIRYCGSRRQCRNISTFQQDLGAQDVDKCVQCRASCQPRAWAGEGLRGVLLCARCLSAGVTCKSGTLGHAESADCPRRTCHSSAAALDLGCNCCLTALLQLRGLTAGASGLDLAPALTDGKAVCCDCRPVTLQKTWLCWTAKRCDPWAGGMLFLVRGGQLEV